jgi:hypothetical protein
LTCTQENEIPNTSSRRISDFISADLPAPISPTSAMFGEEITPAAYNSNGSNRKLAWLNRSCPT